MSNSVSDQKVEDVLSSVRRLVSSELPRKPKPELPKGPGALVLTDAHRVESTPSSEAVQKSLEDRIAELEAAVGGQDQEFEPDGSEDQAQHRPDRIVYTRPPTGEETRKAGETTLRLSQIALIETGPANEDPKGADEAQVSFRHDSKRPSSKPMPPEAPMAEDVPTMPAASAEVAAFTDPDDVVRNIEARIASGRPISEPLPPEPAPEPEDDFEAALSEAVAASVAGAVAQTAEPERARDTIDASEFSTDHIDPHVTAAQMLAEDDGEDADEDDIAIASEMPGVEAPDADDDALSIEAEETDFIEEPQVSERAEPVEVAPDPELADAPEPEPAQVQEPKAPEAAPESPAETEAAVTALAALPDEEAMRLLVARLIREELQGELGERITRNVRKLVRSEVKRALSSRDLT